MPPRLPRTGPTPFAVAVILAACGSDGPTHPGTPTDTLPRDTVEIPAEARAWIRGHALPFAGSSPDLGHGDLAFLPDLVGDARIVSLGENTHGTRDFFQTKARLVRYLVEEMGFRAFAIEATWPEALRLDRYVRTGEGDPAQLLSGLYFWTWNTEEVLELIEWMRGWNEAGGDVGFYGFDMQYPGMALHNVRAFVAEFDPDASGQFEADLACLGAFANGPDGRFDDRYDEAPDSVQARCRAGLDAALDRLLARRDAYEEAAGADAYRIAVHSVRVARQYERVEARGGSRDEAMAVNVAWLDEHLGGDARMALWAHNFHVSTHPNAMGGYLRDLYGDDMVVFGFSHERGTFTAVRQGGPSQGLGPTSLDAVRDSSLEHHLSTGPDTPYMLDLRAAGPDPGSAWLTGPLWTRFIGCCYDPTSPGRFWGRQVIASVYDVQIHFDTTGPTRVLPFDPPDAFDPR